MDLVEINNGNAHVPALCDQVIIKGRHIFFPLFQLLVRRIILVI